MNVKLVFHCKELVGPMDDGNYDLPDGITVKGFMHHLEELTGFTLADSFFPWTFALVNGREAAWDQVLQDGDFVRILHIVMGG